MKEYKISHLVKSEGLRSTTAHCSQEGLLNGWWRQDS